MSNDTWKGSSGSWTNAAGWTSGVPTATSAVTIGSGDAHVTSAITIASLSNSATIEFVHAGSSTISGNVANAGFFNIDDQTSTGGTNLTVGGTFTNTGYMQFGFSNNSLTAKDTIKVKALVNSIGEIDLNGGTTSAKALLLDVTGGGPSFGVANQVTGTIALSGFSTIEFQSGQFTGIASGATLSLDGTHAFLADATGLTTNSALSHLSLVAGTLDLSDGAKVSTVGAVNNINQIAISTNAGATPTTLAIGAGFINNDTTSVDVGSVGGSVMTVNGAITNNGDFLLGSGALRKSSTVTVKGFTNNGTLSLSSALPTAAVALLNVSGVAGFGHAGVLQGTVALAGNSEVRFTSGQIGTIAFGGDLDLFGKTARIADAAGPNSNSALTGLKDVEGTLRLASGNVLTTGALTIGSFGEVDVDTVYEFGGTGGSLLTVNGAVSNAGNFNLGDDTLTGAANATVNSFVNTNGSLTVAGSFAALERALLNVKSAAGFGVAGHVSGNVEVEGDASIQFASGEITTIDAGGKLGLFGPRATVADAKTPTTNSALTGLANITGELDLDDGANISTTGNLVNNGTVEIDQNEDGSTLTVKQTLTNRGEMFIGLNNRDDPSKVSAARLNNTGSLTLSGGAGATTYAILDVAAAAGFGTAGQLTGAVNLSGRSRIQFTGTGVITTIATGGSLALDGATAVIANASSLTTNSALKGLAVNHGILNLSDGASVTTSGGLNNANSIELDASAFPKVSGGSKLTIGGVLTNGVGDTLSVGTEGNTSGDTVTAKGLANTGSITLSGNSSAAQALVTITGAAGFGTAGTLSGSVTEGGFASVHFASGQIVKIATGATLDLEGAHAFVSEASAAGNSALSGLKDVAGNLALNSGAKVVTTAGLSVEGNVAVDSGEFGGGGVGSSVLNVGGALVDKGIVNIGNSFMTHAVVAFSKLLTNNGDLSITGGASAATKAELDVAGAAGTGAAGVLSGEITLSGFSALRFGSGLISTLQSGASLTLDGAHAVVASGKTAATNNALQGLRTLAGGLTLDDGAVVSTTGPLSVTGQLTLDDENTGGSKLTVGGAFTDSSFDVTIGNSAMTKTSELVATSFVDNGQLSLEGGAATTAQALLDITGAAGLGTVGALQGSVNLNGFSAIEFGSGAITSIASGASVSLDGAHAFIEKGATNSNSALATLTSNDGSLSLQDGSVIAPTGNFTNNSQVSLDESGAGGSQFKVGGTLTNDGEMFIGNGENTSQSLVSAASLTNGSFDSIDLTKDAQLTVSGSVVNNGEVDLLGDTETLKGAVTGTGQFNLESGSTLVLQGSIGAGQTVAFSGADQLRLAANATSFAAMISGFGAGDTVDLTTFGTGTTHSFASSTGVLTLKSGANTANLHFGVGSVASEFAISSSSAGTVIAFH